MIALATVYTSDPKLNIDVHFDSFLALTALLRPSLQVLTAFLPCSQNNSISVSLSCVGAWALQGMLFASVLGFGHAC